MGKNISDLYQALFDTLDGLKEGKVSAEQAQAINDTAQVIVNVAKVEIGFITATGEQSSRFLLDAGNKPKLPAGTAVVSKMPGCTVTRHKLQG